MARGIEGNEISTPKPPPTLKSKTSSQSDKNKGQKSILGFFGKKPDADRTPTTTTNGSTKSTFTKSTPSLRTSNSNPTPAPSSDVPDPPSSIVGSSQETSGKNKENGLPTPTTPASAHADGVRKEAPDKSSPSRKARKAVSYAESESEDEEFLRQLSVNKTNGRAAKRRKVSIEESEDEFGVDAEMEEAMANDDGEYMFPAISWFDVGNC
ncbi:hypothetical protein LTS18_012934 [Coniosporium uncinatum]|uniref:Uncharacterized protein n=1 Tax=Coniosporium uncinatum TaxID=93489 RepID=A0ACC3DIZ8_9PEZI|nr:hypothetical protein LTS18_012934 [Coniosporium uncinatum]